MKLEKYRTLSANRATITTNWYSIDATEQVVGRIASQIASILMGKHKPDFTPHVIGGDKVIVLHADKVKFTGKKEKGKQYISHTRYPGGQKSQTPADIREKNPTDLIRRGVRGMLPKNRLRKEFLNNLFIYVGGEHPHTAQQPKPFTITS